MSPSPFPHYYSNIIINMVEIYMAKGFIAAIYSHFLVMYMLWYTPLFFLVVFATAVVTVHERKVIAAMQTRRGPAKTGQNGILQPFADAFKLILKEYLTPIKSQELVYVIIAILAFIIAGFCWMLPTLTFDSIIFFNEMSILFSFLISIFHVFTVLLAGWSSNSRYTFLGAIRASAQLIAYDVVVILVYLNLFYYSKEFSFEALMEIQQKMGFLSFYMPFQSIIFFISLLAETSRHPFDFPEAESELVSGYNTEYSSIRFALFFLAEYATILYSSVTVVTVFGGSTITECGYTFEYIYFCFKVYSVMWVVLHIRALLPRYRYDQLMEICWKVLVPIQCFYLIYLTYLINSF